LIHVCEGGFVTCREGAHVLTNNSFRLFTRVCVCVCTWVKRRHEEMTRLRHLGKQQHRDTSTNGSPPNDAHLAVHVTRQHNALLRWVGGQWTLKTANRTTGVP
jgi:hypothetical protein